MKYKVRKKIYTKKIAYGDVMHSFGRVRWIMMILVEYDTATSIIYLLMYTAEGVETSNSMNE